MEHVAIADQIDEMHDPDTFITKYIWSQDHKVIAIQYGLTAILVGLVALVLSGLMRLQLGFPDTFDFIDPSAYLQFVTMHGMIMVIYLLTALLLGGFGNYLIPLMVGARDMVFPYLNMLSYWTYLLAVIVLLASFFVPGGPTGAGWTLYPPLVVPAEQTFLSFLTSYIEPSLAGYRDLSRMLVMPAAGLLWLGAYMMLSTQRGLSWIGVISVPQNPLSMPIAATTAGSPP